MKFLWRSVDRWGPGAVALVTLLAVLWYGRQLEGRQAGLQAQVFECGERDSEMRMEIQTLEAYIVSLRERMILAGIKDIPPPPRPVTVRTGADGRPEITQKKRR